MVGHILPEIQTRRPKGFHGTGKFRSQGLDRRFQRRAWFGNFGVFGAFQALHRRIAVRPKRLAVFCDFSNEKMNRFLVLRDVGRGRSGSLARLGA